MSRNSLKFFFLIMFLVYHLDNWGGKKQKSVSDKKQVLRKATLKFFSSFRFHTNNMSANNAIFSVKYICILNLKLTKMSITPHCVWALQFAIKWFHRLKTGKNHWRNPKNLPAENRAWIVIWFFLCNTLSIF